MHHPTEGIAHTTAFVTQVVEHWLEREIAPHDALIRRPIAPWANTLTTELHLTPPWRIDPTTHRTMSERSYHGATSRSTMKDRSDDLSHHERTLLPRSYISLHHEGSIRRPIAPWANALTTELHLAPPWRIDPTTHRTMSERSYHGATSRSAMKDRSDDPSHHERTLLPQLLWLLGYCSTFIESCYISGVNGKHPSTFLHWINRGNLTLTLNTALSLFFSPSLILVLEKNPGLLNITLLKMQKRRKSHVKIIRIGGKRQSYPDCQTNETLITKLLADWFSVMITNQSCFNL